MAGITIIHLSDLHIEENDEKSKNNSNQNVNNPNGKEREPLSPYALANLTAESLAEDFQSMAREHSIDIFPEETFVIITGDITNRSRWEEYEIGKYFIQKLQFHLARFSESGDFPADHIICIPGNHDVELPDDTTKNPDILRKYKYRNFKLFIEGISNYASFARDFTLSNPFINLEVSVPFHVQILDLNSTYNIYSLGKKFSFTKDHQKALDAIVQKWDDAFSNGGQTSGVIHPFRIALMHHQISDLPSEDKEENKSQRSLHNWLLKNHFQIVLFGHHHLADGSIIKPLFQKGGLLALGIGCSFLKGRTLEKGNSYQIVRIGHKDEGQVLVSRRRYAYIDINNGKWVETEKPQIFELDELKEIISATDFRDYIGTPKKSKDWLVIAHCESRKFQNFGTLSPGEQVNANLLKLTGIFKGQLRVLEKDTKPNWNELSAKSAIFLIDSPHYNPYVNDVLERYNTYLAGGDVKFFDSGNEQNIKQYIQIPDHHVSEGILKADKYAGMKVFDAYPDYLLVMRLPAVIAIITKTNDERWDINPNRIIWVVAGIHSKASYAGAMLFTEKNFQLFTANLREACEGTLPPYFEAVYDVPISPDRIDDFNKLKLRYFSQLRLKSEISLADDLPPGAGISFLDEEHRKRIPFDTVHFDPVAACNFNCPKCIEMDVKGKKIFLSMSACVRILCDLKENGCRNLNFYGGEPTLHPDFDKILRLSSNLGFEILLVTNGSQLGEPGIRDAIVYGKKRIRLRVSIDGGSAESHKHNHSLSEDHYDKIVESTKYLIDRSVLVSVSYLLHKDLSNGMNSINDLTGAADFWKANGASAFILRPVTGKSGKTPSLDFSPDDIISIQEVIKKYKGFVFAPKWFQELLNKSSLPETKHEFQTCYSGYYRVAISPVESQGKHRIRTIGNVKMTETDNAWISFCTYQRYNPDFGCKYPSNLKSWCEEVRQSELMKIIPANHCDGIICCRHEYNQQIQDLIDSGKNEVGGTYQASDSSDICR